MKKNLFSLLTAFTLFGLVFSSCSKEENSWQDIPKKLEGTNVEFMVNNESAVGSVEFNPQSAVSAQVTLSKVINGYSEVVLDVVMVEQENGSFNFSGEKEMTVAPVKADATPAIVLIKVSGNVTLDGKAKIDISTSGAGLAVGTYQDQTLVLKYSDAVVPGKTVIVDAQSLSDLSIKLVNVIPGEKESILSGLRMNNGVISGTAKTAGGTQLTCDGSISKNILTLNLKDIKINDPKGWAGSYTIADYTTGDFKVSSPYGDSDFKNWVFTGALYANWVNPVPERWYSALWGGLFHFAGSAVLPQVLYKIHLDADGNVRADIQNKPKVTFDPNWMMSVFSGAFPEPETITSGFPNQGWETSPKSLAYWFEKDGKIYIKLDIAAIIAKELGGENPELMALINSILNGGASGVKDILKNLLKVDISAVSDKSINMLLACAKDGFPLNVLHKDGRTQIFLDKDFFDPLMTMRETGIVDDEGTPEKTSDLLELVKAISAANLLPPEAQAILALLPSICADWEGTTEFGLGVELKK